MADRYEGAEPATAYNVGKYLRENYVGPNDELLTEEFVTELVRQNEYILEDAARFGSYAHYAADKIADEANLEEMPDEDDE